MKNDLSDLEFLLAEDCAENPVRPAVRAIWAFVLLAVIAVPLLIAMLRS